MTITSLPPQAVDAECAIIGSILFDPKAIGIIADNLSASAFYSRANNLIYGVVLELHRKNQPTDLITVSQALRDRKILDSVGGESYLIQAVESTVSAVNVDQYAKLVNQKYLRRQLIDIGYKIIEMGHDPIVEIEESLDKASSMIFGLKTDRGDSQITLDEGWNQLIYDIEHPEESVKPILTGLDSYDEMTGGLRAGELLIVAGRPSMGKSWLGNFFALTAARTGNPVLFFSAEMAKRSLVDRFICTLSKVDLYRIINRDMTDRALHMLFDAYTENYGNFPIIIDDTNGSALTMQYIITQCQKLYMNHSAIGGIIIDYIQLIGDANSMNRAQSLGAIAQGFKELAKDFECPVVALAQINRGVEGRQDKRPSMADIKDSGGIEQAADVVAALYRDKYYNPESGNDELEIIVTKNRNGPTGTAKCFFVPESGLFFNTRAALNRLEAELLHKYPH
jgi:replicative DNA helicase